MKLLQFNAIINDGSRFLLRKQPTGTIGRRRMTATILRQHRT
jgi:hypothetical protein